MKKTEEEDVNWTMNANEDLIESRMEVQFFDKYDLLGVGNAESPGIARGKYTEFYYF